MCFKTIGTSANIGCRNTDLDAVVEPSKQQLGYVQKVNEAKDF